MPDKVTGNVAEWPVIEADVPLTKDAPRILLAGESNPYSRNEEDALLPWPPEASGNRLRLILGMTEDEYLAAFPLRRNLCQGAWLPRAAKMRAASLMARYAPNVVVALGRRVATAFATAGIQVKTPPPFGAALLSVTCEAVQVPTPSTELEVRLEAGPRHYVCLLALPHPSGRCREWQVPYARERARMVLREALG